MFKRFAEEMKPIQQPKEFEKPIEEPKSIKISMAVKKDGKTTETATN